MVPSLFNGSVPASACTAASIPYPSLFGAEILSLEATYVANVSLSIPIGVYSNQGAVDVVNATYCNVTVSYTHPGQNDQVNVQVWLPADTWNGRLQAIGGSGFQAGLHWAGLMGMLAAVGEGYATVGTDAGLGSVASPDAWALVSEGNVNLFLLQNLGSTSLNDASIIAKSVINSFYGEPAKYAYFNGCSQGGRQGLMLAQRYPDAYDGIAASAPAIYWNQLFTSMFWPSLLIDSLGEAPPACEIDAITDAALEACDSLDGVIDGVVSDPDNCNFDAASLIGTVINCTTFGTKRTISSAAAQIVQSTWDGARRTDNSSLWYGPYKGGLLTGSITDPAIVSTSCSSNGTCTRGNMELVEGWMKFFGLKSANASLTNLSHEEFDRVAKGLVQQFESVVGTHDPDLSSFKARGGKLLGFHGMTDSIIPARGTLQYYESVAALDPNIHDFYRVFLAPGVNHCFGGNGPYPDTTFEALRNWVEHDAAPESITATSIGTAEIIKRNLCPYPKKQTFHCASNSTAADYFTCTGTLEMGRVPSDVLSADLWAQLETCRV